VSAEPVTAHEIITFRCMASPNAVAVGYGTEMGRAQFDLPHFLCPLPWCALPTAWLWYS
jgi:hypothetical protein